MNDLVMDHPGHDGAECLAAGCRASAGIELDLRLLASALRGLPPARRPRDFRLSEADARRLARPGWRRLLGVFRTDAFRPARPVGATLASLGFAGLVFATALGRVAPRVDGEAATGVGPAAIGDAAGEPREMTTTGVDARPAPPAPPGAGDVPARSVDGDEPRTTASPRANDTIVVLSGSLFIVGLGLFGLRWTADRLGDG